MSFREYVRKLEDAGALLQASGECSTRYEVAGALKALEPKPVLFTHLIESSFAAAGNLFCTKASVAEYLGFPVAEMIPRLAKAIQESKPCEVVKDAPCQDVVELAPDLDRLPILRHCEQDGGNYISSGVMAARHPQWGLNLDFHRLMQLSKTEMAVRVVRNRHFDAYLRDLKVVEVAVCVGVAPNVLVAAATSVERGVNEMDIANALAPLKLVKARTVDVLIPAEAEFVLEGKVYLERTHAEGPFVDLTETYDVVREEPVFEVQAITHRSDAIWHALLPGGLEHKLLMGMPREPTIMAKVNQVARCLDVHINPGGCSWLHAIVKIRKEHEDDGKKAIRAAFEGHKSCKHVFVVDEDIDIYNPQEVEWAMATRFQADRDLVMVGREAGSSLDPSAEVGSSVTCKVGFDLTRPLETKGKTYTKAAFPVVELKRILGD